ncbi:nitrous oxide reductase family maturation protein NosD [Leptospira sp. 201903070]|uniref:Nitrous oxide reductase family maturation protein NosD n=1 Tax=Leptospira ainlahdjerensis TaxID=2810033 RepID=A0ABS2UH80_9LEPT|nr:nitrous oxide reductase family maturation protein NosD [Leptospira ainlahdjerensis]MBM9579746.1 nitrous oxide reductase family maturation protein NosD [Leptospira ainlahdjerensis]
MKDIKRNFFANRRIRYGFFLFCFFWKIGPTADLDSKEIRVCSLCPLNSIQKAIDSANPGDKIRIEAGLYEEASIIVNKSLVIEGSSESVIDGKKNKHVIDVQSDRVTIRNLKIRGSEVSDTNEFAGVHAEKVQGCIFENLVFEDNAYALYLAEVDGCKLLDNRSNGNAENEVSGGNGIHLWSSKNVRIVGNHLERHRDGIYLEFSSNLKIEKNFSKNNIRYGMHFMFSSDNDFRKNTFQQNSAGVAVMYSKNILIEDNVFAENWGDSSYGLLLKEISDSILIKNTFQNNTIAVFADGSNRNYFTYNEIVNNGWGIRVLGNSDQNQFVKNDFKSNVFDISTNTKRTTNTFQENYWDGYKGYDLDQDRYGDVSHKPVHFFGYWVAVYPFLMILYQSPVVIFLQGIENAFPIVTPIDFEDRMPSMRANR